MIAGIAAGLLCALLQALSYVCSAGFMRKYHSSLRLVIFSQLGMGMFSLPLLPFFYPRGLGELAAEFWLWVGIWVVVFVIGQVAFFNALRSIEASRMSSLLGLKIIVLSLIAVVVLRQELNPLQWAAVLISTVAAVGMNWSGGAHFTWKGIGYLAAALVFYSLTDMAETHLVRLPREIGIFQAAIGMGVVCYGVLGVLTLPLLWRFRWTKRQFVLALPFAVTWFLSQVVLFVCFGLLGTVFGNVIQASRGLISIGIGIVLLRFGLGKLDAEISGAMWIRRIVAAVLMTAGIVLYSLASA